MGPVALLYFGSRKIQALLRGNGFYGSRALLIFFVFVLVLVAWSWAQSDSSNWVHALAVGCLLFPLIAIMRDMRRKTKR